MFFGMSNSRYRVTATDAKWRLPRCVDHLPQAPIGPQSAARPRPKAVLGQLGEFRRPSPGNRLSEPLRVVLDVSSLVQDGHEADAKRKRLLDRAVPGFEARSIFQVRYTERH